MFKRFFQSSRLIYGLILLSFLSFTGGSCGQQLKYITLTPDSPTIGTPGVAFAVRPGIVNVTASLGGASGSTPLTVSSATLQSITITPLNPTIPKGITLVFTALGNYSDGSSRDVSSIVAWSSSSTTVATVNPIGQATAIGSAGSTSAITATLGATSGNSVLTVSSATLQTITISPASPTLPVGLTQQFSATGTYFDGISSTTYDVSSLVVWSSSSTPSTSVATFSSSGLATAIGPGVLNVSASIGSITGNSTMTVTNATLTLMAVSTPSSLSIPTGRSVQFTAIGTYSDNSTYDLTSLVAWSVGTPTVAFVNNFGLATAIGPANLTSTITAALNGISGNATITVSTAALQLITITPLTPTIPTGSLQKFTATANYSDGTNYDVSSLVTWVASVPTATNPVATMVAGMVQQFRAMGTYNGGTVDISSSAAWSSANPEVANIYLSGYALAFGSGTTLITVFLDGISASTTLTVSPAVAMKSITITPANLTLAHGSSQQFTATGNYFDGSSYNLTQYVTWSSDNPAIVVMNTAGVGAGVAGGTANISATLGSFSGSTALIVSP
jgi:hypothetical protein